MHDGQNLFDDLTAFGSEWGVDETLDNEHGEVIIIGIENGAEHRMGEYMLHDHPEHGTAEGALYLKDVAGVLKPFIDTQYRVLPGREHTGIAGSSMGGLISVYAGLLFADVFGNIGVFSPALWVDAPDVFKLTQEILNRNAAQPGTGASQRWYFYAGGRESETMLAEVATLVKIMRESPQLEVAYQLDASGMHDEAIWKNYFPEFYQWFVRKKSTWVLERASDIKID